MSRPRTSKVDQGGPRGGNTFRLSELFPEFNGERKPFPKQEQVFWLIRSGAVQGGGIVFQGGKGSSKTITGAVATIWVHHQPAWKGCDTVIGRESYPSLVTSTANEFFQIVDRLPDRLIKAATKPSKNSMGWVEWAIGGKTWLVSLSNADTWESANFGFAWVDEGHRQNPSIIGDLETRLRQINGPRVMLITSNPGGKGWMWKMAHPDSPVCRRDAETRKPLWAWIEASTLDNPALPPDYIRRLKARYGVDTPAFRRWVLGQSTALEGSIFTDFDTEVENCLHVVPPFDLPENWTYGRGLDYGLVNPTAVVWAAFDDEQRVWVDRVHYHPETPEESAQWTVERHSECILDIDAMYPSLAVYPSDPSIWAKIHLNKITGVMESTADEFMNHGVLLTQANNDRKTGLQRLMDLVSIDREATHPVSLEPGCPKLFVLDRPENAPLIREFAGLLWAKPDGTVEQGRPDDCMKKDDHTYDALRYLVMEQSISDQPEPIVHRGASGLQKGVVGSRGKQRSY